MIKGFFSWILFMIFFTFFSQGYGKSVEKIKAESLSENNQEIRKTTFNATTGEPVTAAIFANNSLSCCEEPVAGIFFNRPEKKYRAVHFQPVWQTPFSPMTFYFISAKVNGSNLQAGAEIGIFDVDPISGNEICVGAGVIVEELNGTNYLEITASMNDGTNPDQSNGFTAGNPVIYRLWTNETGEIALVEPTYPYPGYDEFFAALGTAFVELTGFFEITQSMGMQAGWNLTSFLVQPQNPDMLSVVQPLIAQGILCKVLDEKGGSIFQLPFSQTTGQWSNTIGNLENTEGYYFKLTETGNLTLSGIPVALPFSIPLSQGWNIISYPFLAAQNALQIVQPLIDAGVFYKMIDDEGGLISYVPFPWPDGQWINTIGDLQTGKGYYLNVLDDTTLNYSRMDIVPESARNNHKLLQINHFSLAWENNPFMPMHIILEANEELTFGDEIGVFDGDVCVGASVFNENINDPIIVICSLDDPDSEIVDGFTDGNEIFFKIWDNETQTINYPEIEFLEGQFSFAALESFAGRILDLTTGIDDNITGEFTLVVTPNPATNATFIETNIPESGTLIICIHNVHGQTVLDYHENVSPGGFFRLPLGDFANTSGIYLLSYEYVYKNKIITGSHKIIKQQ